LFFINDAAMTTPQLHTTKTIDRKWLVFIAIGTGSFMVALDGSVVNAILPILRDTFNSNVATIEWVVTIYLLVLSGLLLSFGRLGDLRGHRSLYILGFVAFVASSALCGMARSAEILIFFRGLQAIGGALLASNSPAIVTGNFPVEERGRAFGLVSMMTYLGLTVGPSLGGWLTHAFGWRTVFYINVPVRLLALILNDYIPDSPPASASACPPPCSPRSRFFSRAQQGRRWAGFPSVLGLMAGAVAFGRVHPDRAALPPPHA
jgi:MFS family permease